jgi:hypothetical protein
LDIKTIAMFNKNDDTKGLFGIKFFNQVSAYVEAIFRTGRRYTPYLYVGDETISGRPIYERDNNPEHVFQKIGSSNFWLNATFKKWWNFKKSNLSFILEITNLLNNKNAAIINPATGRAYEYGDPVPTEWRDPKYLDPRDPRSYGLPPDNPARYYEQIHIMLGITFGF